MIQVVLLLKLSKVDYKNLINSWMMEVDEYIVTGSPNQPCSLLRIAVTEASSDTAFAFLYRIFADQVFGANQSVHLVLYETPIKAKFLESHIIQLTSSSPNMLWGVESTDELSHAFKHADIVVCIGKARAYEFTEEEYRDDFFKESMLTMRSYGEHIERYAKRDVKVIVLGNTAATVLAHYARSIPSKNITALAMFNLKLSSSYIAEQANCRPDEIKNLIIWGTNNNHTFPDCRYLHFSNGTTMSDELRVWTQNELPKMVHNTANRSRYTRSMAFALADHCKLLWNGTKDDEWTCMSVLSDNSYGVQRGIFFAYPVYCKNKEYEIVQDLLNKENIKRHIRSLSRVVRREVQAAFKACGTQFAKISI